MSQTNLSSWNVEDEGFWENTGKDIAKKNLWISIPALLLAFAVWIMWGMLVTYMKDFGFTFGLLEGLKEGTQSYTDALGEINSMYYTLPAIAGLAGATLRLPNSFLIALGGGRNVIFVTTAFLLIPVIGAGYGLSDINTSYNFFAAMALLSGFGGGNFASSMNNISYFFPKKMQGYALGMNAGIGNLGVAIMQKLIPTVVPIVLFAAVGTSVVDGVEFAGVQNAGWVWVPLLIISVLAAYFGMNNVITGTPKLPTTAQGVKNTLIMVLLGLIAAATGAYLLVGLGINMWLDTGNVQIIARKIKQRLIEINPSNKEKYNTNYLELESKLNQLNGALKLQLEPLKSTPFAVFADRLQYLEEKI